MRRLFRFSVLLLSVSLTACATYESYPAYTNGYPYSYPYGYYPYYPYYGGPWVGVGIYGSHFNGGHGHGGHGGVGHGGIGTGANSRMGGPGGSGTVFKR